MPSQAALDETGLLQRFNPSNRFLEPAGWPESLAEIRKQLVKPAARMDRQHPAADPHPNDGPDGVAEVPALVIGTPMVMLSHLAGNPARTMSPMTMSPEVRHTVLLLDADFIRRDMLSALARQHFQGTGDGFDYQLAVVPTASRVHGSGLPFGARVRARRRVRRRREGRAVPGPSKDFDTLVNEVNRFATFTATMPRHIAGGRTFIRETPAPPPGGGVAIRSTPMSIVVQRGGPADVQQRVDRLIAGAATYSVTGRPNVPPPPHWRLLVKRPPVRSSTRSTPSAAGT